MSSQNIYHFLSGLSESHVIRNRPRLMFILAHLASGRPNNASKASITTPVTVLPCLSAYFFVLSISRHGRLTTNCSVSSEHIIGLDPFSKLESFLLHQSLKQFMGPAFIVSRLCHFPPESAIFNRKPVDREAIHDFYHHAFLKIQMTSTSNLAP